MATTDPLTGVPVYQQTDQALGGLQAGNVASGLAPFALHRFASTAARDAAWSAWSTANSSAPIPNGASCWCDSPGSYYDRIGGAWVQRQAAGSVLLVATETAQVATNSAAATRIAGGQNITNATLTPGRAYRISYTGTVGTTGGYASVVVTCRIAKTLVPTTSSPSVASDQQWIANSGGQGEVGFRASGQPFAVTAAGTYQIHVFGRVRVGSGPATNVYINPDDSGGHTQVLEDAGPAFSGVRTLSL